MTPFEIGLTSFGAMVVLVYMGLWVPFALMLSLLWALVRGLRRVPVGLLLGPW